MYGQLWLWIAPEKRESGLPIYSLSCANCSAPLEIGSDTERFICAHCGSAQILERQGGIISLKKVENSLHAIQRGTDRTAAELAIPRLTQEKQQILALRAQALEAHQKKRAHARGRRLTLAGISFLVLLLAGPTAINQIKMTALNTALTLAWMLSLIVIPVLVFLKTRMPRSTSAQQVISDYDAQLASIEAHLQANRAIVSTLPS